MMNGSTSLLRLTRQFSSLAVKRTTKAQNSTIRSTCKLSSDTSVNTISWNKVAISNAASTPNNQRLIVVGSGNGIIDTVGVRSFSSSSDGDQPSSNNAANKEWNKFQASIQETSSSTAPIPRKKRGGKAARRIAAKKAAASASILAGIDPTLPVLPSVINGYEVPNLDEWELDDEDKKSMQFPNLELESREETYKLLHEAYENLPIRTGKRGTRNLKRQRFRFKVIRRAKYVKKLERIAEHGRRMEQRSRIAKECQQWRKREEGGGGLGDVVVGEEEKYKMDVLKRWCLMNGLAEGVGESGDAAATANKVEEKV